MESIQMDQMYEGIVKTRRQSLLILDKDLMVILASSYFYELFKVSPEETVGHLVYDIGNKQWDIPKLRELIETILPEKTSFDNYEVEHDFANIGKRTMLLNARQIEQAMGKERIILLAIEDVSESRQLKNLLADSEERYRRLFETADDGLLLLEKSELKICFANPAITEMLGYSNEELIGKSFKNIGFADNIGNFQEVIQTLNKSGIIYYKDASIQKKTGQFVDTDIYMVNKTRLVQCNIRNITERKEAENVLRETEEKFSTAFQTSPYAITITRAKDGKFIDVNDAFMTMTGFTREEAHADSWIGLKLWMNKEDRDRVVNDLRAGRSSAMSTSSGERVTRF